VWGPSLLAVFIKSSPVDRDLSRFEVLVKAEHDFYREKWQKEKNKK
jgi:hypothetical protein